jgi:hypothetical protein
VSVPAPASTPLIGGPEPGAQAHRAHIGVITAFVAAGIAFSGLAARLPDVRALLALTPSQLGLLLLAVSSAAVISLPSSGWLCGRIGAARARCCREPHC